MVEAMSAGVVPVATDLPTLRDLLDGSTTGLRVSRLEAAAFADAVEALARDRARLERMSAAARNAVRGRFDGRTRASAYQELFGKWRELYRTWPGKAAHGSRLDKPWIPNTFVRFVRTALRSAR
jgi:glycosyltransferase involved in cell wall biosynthesis